jgi:hypothetical protein
VLVWLVLLKVWFVVGCEVVAIRVDNVVYTIVEVMLIRELGFDVVVMFVLAEKVRRSNQW